jgi:hypothetical protein
MNEKPIFEDKKTNTASKGSSRTGDKVTIELHGPSDSVAKKPITLSHF